VPEIANKCMDTLGNLNEESLEIGRNTVMAIIWNDMIATTFS